MTGHSYSDADMSTQTLIVDMAVDRVAGDLEKFEVSRDGKPFEAPDFNFWGVTFARDPNRFYATLSRRAAGPGSCRETWPRTSSRRSARTWKAFIAEPRRKALAFKKRMAGPGSWRLHLLDSATLEDRALAREERPIDDQVELARRRPPPLQARRRRLEPPRRR